MAINIPLASHCLSTGHHGETRERGRGKERGRKEDRGRREREQDAADGARGARGEKVDDREGGKEGGQGRRAENGARVLCTSKSFAKPAKAKYAFARKMREPWQERSCKLQIDPPNPWNS